MAKYSVTTLCLIALLSISQSSQAEKIVAKHSGKCLDVYGGSTADKTQVIQYRCTDGAPEQSFRLDKLDNGYYRIVAKHSGKCLDVYGGSTEDKTNLIQYDCQSGHDEQLFRLIEE